MYHIEVSGDSHACGEQEGQQCREGITLLHQKIRTSLSRFRQDERAAFQRNFLKHLGCLAPETIGWLEGIASGSGLSFRDVVDMNIGIHGAYFLSPACCVVGVLAGPAGSLLGRNCDLNPGEDRWQVCAVTRYDDHPYSGVYTGYVGLAERIGMNCHGLTVGGASLAGFPSTANELRLPFSCRFVLEHAATTAEALALLRQHGFMGKSANVGIVDATGRGARLELTNARQTEVPLGRDDTYFYLTNHSVMFEDETTSDVGDSYRESSRERYRAIGQCFERTSKSEYTPEFVMGILRTHPICQHGPRGFITTYSTVAVPKARRLYLCDGNPCRDPYRCIDLKEKGFV